MCILRKFLRSVKRISTKAGIMRDQAISTVSVTLIAPLIKVIQKQGVSASKYLEKAGLNINILDSSDNRISLEEYRSLFLQGKNLTHDPFFSLHAGEAFTTMSNIIGFIMVNCATVGEALEKYIKYQIISDEVTHYELIENIDDVYIHISINDKNMEDVIHLADFNAAGFISYWQVITGKYFYPKEIQLRHSPPQITNEYSRLFHCPVIFNADDNLVVVSRKSLQDQIWQPNAELRKFFEGNIDHFMDEKVLNLSTIANKVNNILFNAINYKVPSEEDVANSLLMSTRNLQYKLRMEGTTYRTLIDNVRMEMAQKYLRDKQIPVEEISYKLGFSAPSVFSRSFKRWMGITPGQWRELNNRSN